LRVSGLSLAGVAVGTLLSEDLATIAAAGLVQGGHTTAAAAATACVVGVYAGDLALWVVGRALGRRVLGWPRIAARIDGDAIRQIAARLDRHLGATVVASRFLPGSRLPMYVAAGIWGRRPLAFAAWSFGAVLLWTPTLLLAALALGEALASTLIGLANQVVTQVAAAGAVIAALRMTTAALRRLRPRMDAEDSPPPA
jgi:membrane protein DedA with SNARE-associated domain